jgi:integrase
MQREYDIIRNARSMLQASHTSRPSQRTIAGYEAKAKRLYGLVKAGTEQGIESFIVHAKQTRSAATWFSRRAALLYLFRTALTKLLSEQDKVQRALKAGQVPTDSPQWDPWRRMVARAGIWMDWISRLQSESGPAIEDRKPRHSKRKDMRGLPDDWRERIVARLPKYRYAALTQAVTGCRPDELVKGVKLSIVDGQLIAEIQGSKLTEKSGQPWRRLIWPTDSESPLVAMLVHEVQNGLSITKIEDAKTYSGAVRAAGKRAWPERRKSITPYCFRHAAASDMKAAGIDDASISQALGHCADVARSYYGQWQQGRAHGGVSPKMVQAPRQVRITKPALATTRAPGKEQKSLKTANLRK